MYWLIVAASLIAFAVWWCIVCCLLGWLGGWTRLARRYRAYDVPEGTVLRFQSASLGWVNYNGCLTLIVHPQGLYLAPIFLFRPGQPPLSIPWPDFHNLQRKQVLFWEYVVAEIGPDVIRLKLPLAVLQHKPAEPPQRTSLLP